MRVKFRLDSLQKLCREGCYGQLKDAEQRTPPKNQQHCCASGKFAKSSTIKDNRDEAGNISVNDKKKKKHY